MDRTSKANIRAGALVPYLIKTILGKAPSHLRMEFETSFGFLAYVQWKQRLLHRTSFGLITEQTNYDLEHEICQTLNLAREELDPDRVIWVASRTLQEFLIRPGQWVKLEKFHNSTSSKCVQQTFICQILPSVCSEPSEEDNTHVIKLNAVTEYNLRRALNIPMFIDMPNVRIKPLLTDSLLKTPNKPRSFMPIQAKSVTLTGFMNHKSEYELLLNDIFNFNCKYLCVGDMISVITTDSSRKYNNRMNLIVTEINGKGKQDKFTEIFRISKASTSLSVSSNVLSNQCNLKLCPSQIDNFLEPSLVQYFTKLKGWVLNTLMSIYLINTKGTSERIDLWPNILVYGPVGSGKTTLCQTLAAQLGFNFHMINAANFIGDTSAYSEAKFRALHDQMKNSLCPVIIFIKNIHLVGKDKEGQEDKRVILAFKEFLRDIATFSVASSDNVTTSSAAFIIGVTEMPDQLVPSITHNFLFKLELPSASESTEASLRWLLNLSGLNFETGGLRNLAKDNNDFEGMQRSFGDLKAVAANVVRNTCGRTWENTENRDEKTVTISVDDLRVGLRDVDVVLRKAASTIEVPKVYWEDIGGLEDVKRELINSVRLPLEFPHLFGEGNKRSGMHIICKNGGSVVAYITRRRLYGILLYGPPGTGKTLIAKAVATEFKMNFFSVKGPELLNMYVGQSEQNVREVFSKARKAAPCIIFFDELDALAPNRGGAGDSGGVMDRVVSQILAELDGTHSTQDVFIIGATNRPDLIDPALLRPGRFDKLLHVGINQDLASKISVLEALTRKFYLSEDVDLQKVASLLPKGMSGADIYSLCSDTFMTAVERHISTKISNTEVARRCILGDHEGTVGGDKEANILIENSDFESALARTIPSLSENEQIKYEAFKLLSR